MDSFQNLETSPQTYARIGGVLYLIIIVAGIFAEVLVRDKLIVSGDATATAHNIIAYEQLWRLGFAGGIIMLECDTAVSLILYMLLRPISKNLALLAAFFRLVSIAILGINELNHFAALFPLGGANYLKAFEPDQLDAMAYLSIKSFSEGYNISLVFFGFHCLFLGYLIYRSGYFPKILGLLLIICFLSYVTNSFAWFLAPAFADKIYPAVLVPAFIGELSLCLWLIVKGVNVPNWTRQVSMI